MNSIKSRGRHYISAILLVLVGVWFDQFTKTLAVNHLKGQDPFILFKNVFQFEYLENHGAAFGILQNKQIFFFIIVLIMASSMGKGCVFSFIPVAALQGSMTALAVLLSGFMTTPVLDNLSLVGNILIFCVGVNLVCPKTIKVANLLPSLVVAVVLTTVK